MSVASSTIVLVTWFLTQGAGQSHHRSGSMCDSISYRGLPMQVQNEHQCLVLEQLHRNFRSESTRRDVQITGIISRIGQLDAKVSKGLSRSCNKRDEKNGGFLALKDVPMGRDCNELFMAGVDASGVYPIVLPNGAVLNVQCDMVTEGGGWTVIQQRQGGVVNFTRKWDDYSGGFGNVNTEYWLGNTNIHSITTATRYSLRVDLWDWKDDHAHAFYSYFHVDAEDNGYKLTVEGYENSTAGDALLHHNGMKFSTIDRDNDEWWASCAKKDQSGWWFNHCSFCSLNGVFHAGGNHKPNPDGTSTGITWFEWTQTPGYSLKRVQMKIKPVIAVMMYNEQVNRTEAAFH